MKTKGVRDAKHGGAPTNARRPRRPVVLCAGIAVIDFIFRVERFPTPGTKTPTHEFLITGGDPMLKR